MARKWIKYSMLAATLIVIAMFTAACTDEKTNTETSSSSTETVYEETGGQGLNSDGLTTNEMPMDIDVVENTAESENTEATSDESRGQTDTNSNETENDENDRGGNEFEGSATKEEDM